MKCTILSCPSRPRQPQDAHQTFRRRASNDLKRLLFRLGAQKHNETCGFSYFFAARHNASKTHRRRPKTPPRPIQDASKKKLQPSWGRLRASSGVLGRLGTILGAFWSRLGGVFLAPWGRLFFGVDFGVILDVILDHFGVDFGSNFQPFLKFRVLHQRA